MHDLGKGVTDDGESKEAVEHSSLMTEITSDIIS